MRRRIALTLFTVVTIAMVPSARAQWVRSTANFGGTVSCLGFKGSTIFAAANGMFRSTDDGNTWTKSNTGLPQNVIYSIVACGNNVFAGVYGQGVYRSTNDGDTWENVTTALDINGMAVRGTSIFACCKQGIYRSTNSGTSWSFANTGLTSTYMFDIAVSGTNLIAIAGYTGAFRSTDNGNKWTSAGSGLGGYYIQSVAALGSSVFASDGPAIFRTTNNGISWTNINSGLTNTFTIPLEVSGTNIFAAADHGMFLSMDSGATWIAVSSEPELVDAGIRDIEIVNGKIYVCTGNGVIWSRPLSQMVPTSSVSTKANRQSPIAIYPNPLSTSATIAFTSESGEAQVSIVNLLGAEVTRLFDGHLDQGEHSFTWQPAGLPDGVYECAILMNGRIEKLPLMLLH